MSKIINNQVVLFLIGRGQIYSCFFIQSSFNEYQTSFDFDGRLGTKKHKVDVTVVVVG
jgi:hypothetical protein